MKTEINTEQKKSEWDLLVEQVITLKEHVVTYVNEINTLWNKVREVEILDVVLEGEQVLPTTKCVVNQHQIQKNFEDVKKEFYKIINASKNVENKAAITDYLTNIDKDFALGIFTNNPDFNSAHHIITYIITKRQDAVEWANALPNSNPMTSSNDEDYDFEMSKSTTTFDDVAGLAEVKEDLLQIVDFIKNPMVYKEFGAKLPKGVLLYGNPGTGKTLLARAIAGQSQANFISTNGSDFTAKHWGVVPKMIKSLFKQARENAPCIIFIDEIDMLTMNRGADASNSLAHRESLNAFLSEMDGFNQYEGVVVIGATNRLEDLDPAVLRAGRFDNQFSVPLPNSVDEVEEIVKIYMRKKKFSEEITSRGIAKKMLGQSPANIQGILNEACLIAIKENKGIINTKILDDAVIKKAVKGHIKKKQDLSSEESRVVAYHEAGHALIALLEGRKVQSVNILGTTTGAGGLTVTDPIETHLWRKQDFEDQLRISYGGRAAEELIFGKTNITSGASGDIRNATSLIRSASANYGFDFMSDTDDAPKIFYQDTELKIEQVEAISKKYYTETVDMLQRNKLVLHQLADSLLENGTITGEKCEDIFDEFR